MVRWWCRLDGNQWSDPGALAKQAQQWGVQAWVVDVEVGAGGALLVPMQLQDLQADANAGAPALALRLQLRQPLSPQDEERLAQALAGWLQQPGALQLDERPVLLVGCLAGLSHACFGPRRLRLSLQRELRRLGVSAEPWLVGPAMGEAWDGIILVQCCEAGRYRSHLQRVNHGPWPQGSWIPEVRAPQPQDKGGSAELYAEWLEQAGAVSRCQWSGVDEAPVLLHSWLDHQQWWSPPAADASGVAPSPRSKGGLSVMTEAVCMAWGKPDPQHVALLVHGFYPDRLADLLKRIPQPDGGSSGLCVDLYLSTPLQQLESVAELLKAQGWRRVRLFGLDNRGRDQAPFLLHLLPAALREGHDVFVKLHTKRSSHLSDGEAWAQHLFDSLASPKALQHCLERLQHNPGLGLLAPAGTLMPCSVALSANLDHLLTLCTHWGVNPATLLQQRFIAGSMMAGRLKALQPICQLGLQLADFEPEQGQTDGTLAHAMERWLCCASAAQGWQIEELPGERSAVPDFGHGRPPDDQSRPASDLR